MASFDALFHPRGIAVVGASRDLARPGGRLVQAMQDFGYTGHIHPVNARGHDTVAGRRCYASVLDIEGPCDLAILAVRAEATVDALRACAAHRIPCAIVHAGGFREAGAEGRRLERELVEVARAGNVRLIGPNCLGVLNVPDRVYAGLGPMMREPRLPPGNVSVVSQSGGFGYSLALRCAADGAGIRCMANTGNEADISTPELIEYFLDDPQTHVIVSYVEGLPDGRALMAAGQKAARCGKPVLLWKAGRREQGVRAVASHTASMTGRYDVFRAALAQAGIVEVSDVDELADLVRVLTAGKLARGGNIALTGGSGGAAIVFADSCDETGLVIPALSPVTVDALRRVVPTASPRGNPVDYVGGWLDDPNAPMFREVIRLLLADDGIDQLCVMFSTAQGKPARSGAEILAEAARGMPKPILVFSSAPADSIPDVHRIFREARIPVLRSPGRTARAAAALARLAAMRARVASGARVERAASPRAATTGRRVLDEHRSKQLLAQAGIAVTCDVVIRRGEPIPGNLVYPVAAKVLSADVPHKSDAGGVRLDVRDAAALREAIDGIERDVARRVPRADIDGVIVSEMVCDAAEVIVGAIDDEVFGPTILLGMGGVLTEVLRDVTYRVAPFDIATAHDMIAALGGAAVLRGVRGRPPCDVDALAQTLCRVSQWVWAARETLLELDINPLFVRPVGGGVVAADALAVVTP